jgi:3-phenylpropionate/trans-cinnamate dioxygenase ferredoxin reductase subunit
MPNDKAVVIAGSGMAGAYAAESLRANGFQERIFLVGDENRLPYERPPLSKELLVGSKTFPDAVIRTRQEWLDLAIHLVPDDPVTGLDPSGGRVELASGLSIRAEKVLLATGGTARTLNVPGWDLPGVRTLRTIVDADRLSDRLRRGRSNLVVIGGGFLAVEVASAALTLGNRVTWVCRSRAPLASVVGVACARELGTLYAEHDIELIQGHEVASFDGQDRLTGVRLDDGRRLDADLALVAIGQEPALGFLDHRKFGVGNGVHVDQNLESVVPGVFAAGDVANFDDPYVNSRVRYGTWLSAQKQGEHAGRAMTGDTSGYRNVPWCWSDHLGSNIQVTGRVLGGPPTVTRRHDDGAVSFVYLAEDRVVGAAGINAQKDIRAVMIAIESSASMNVKAASDPAVDLRRTLITAVTAA